MKIKKTDASKIVLVVSPMPITPTSAGNRQRALALCNLFKKYGYVVHLAIVDHEDKIYRTFETLPPNDLGKASEVGDKVFYIETKSMAPIKTSAKYFSIDDWYPRELDVFFDYYTDKFGNPDILFVNYVFYSKILLKKASSSIGIIDTHDRFSNRGEIYKQMRQEPNFFYTIEEEEKKGFDRADMILAIQDIENNFFSKLTKVPVQTLNHLPKETNQEVPKNLHSFVFIGHGNDVNFISISQFIHAWAYEFNNNGQGPMLYIAGEVGRSLVNVQLPNVKILGYVDNLDDLYNKADIIVAPLIFGTGLKVKVVEALARGKIVIGTLTAFEGIETSHISHSFNSQKEMISYIKILNNFHIQELSDINRSVWNKYKANIDKQEMDLFNIIQYFMKNSITESTVNTINNDRKENSNVPIDSVLYHRNGVLILINEEPIYYNSNMLLEYIINNTVLKFKMIATEHRAILDSNHSMDNKISISRLRLYTGSVDKLDQISSSTTSSFEYIKSKIKNRKFYFDNYIQDLQNESVVCDELIELMHDIGTENPNWFSVAQFVGLEKNLITIITMAPPNLAREGRLKKCDFIVRYLDDTYDCISYRSMNYIIDENTAREVSLMNTRSADDRCKNSYQPLVPMELKFEQKERYTKSMIGIKSIIIRKGLKTGLINL